jgi:hypothetical protein
MSLFISLLGGFAVKVYDDLNDNFILRKFRNKKGTKKNGKKSTRRKSKKN